MNKVNIIDKRGQWQAVGRFWYTRDTKTITKITVHHDAIPTDKRGEDQILQQIYSTHFNQGWPGIAYHLVYFPESNNLYWINDFSLVTWHDAINWDSIGVLVHGYYHAPYNNQVTQKLLSGLREILDELCTQHPEFPAGFSDVYGHRERSSTACPGDLLIPYVQEYRNNQGNVAWGESSNNNNDMPASNIYEKSSSFDQIIIGIWIDERTINLLDELGLLKKTDQRKDNSDKYKGQEVLGFIKGLVARCNHLQPKASNNDRVCDYLGISKDSSFEQIKTAIVLKTSQYKTVGEVITAILPKVKNISLTE